MSRSTLVRLVAGLVLALGLLFLPAAEAAPAGRSLREGDSIGIQQLELVIRKLAQPIADLLGVFQMDNAGPVHHDPTSPGGWEGVGIDPFGRPPRPPGTP